MPRFHFVEGGGAVCIYSEDVAYDDVALLDAEGPRHRLYLRRRRLGLRPRLEPQDRYLLGWGVTRRYGLSAFQPFGNFSFASSSETAGAMITSSPSFQLTGVDTL